MIITKKITQLRRISGLTQQDMADKMNRSVSSYNRLERGETAMTINDMEKIAEILNVPIIEIIEDLQSTEILPAENQQLPLNELCVEKLFTEMQEIKALLRDMKSED